jgi:anhydro-N-acetylmuramic acid kinase
MSFTKRRRKRRKSKIMKTAIGLMSGTSLDGVDAALLRTDGVRVERSGFALTLPYSNDFRARLRAALGQEGPLSEIERELTLIHAQAVRELIKKAGGVPVDLIGFHGQTIFHRPRHGKTRQIGDGALLCELTGIPVVYDFRSADVAAGGEGAPLVPIYHAALTYELEKPLAVVNIGGVANVTWIGENEELLAFDTGPGNAPIDDWVLRHLGQPLDRNGELARQGRVDAERVSVFLALPYFATLPPKSLDRNDFARQIAELSDGLSSADGAATLTAFTAASIIAALWHFPQSPKRWLICGGGRYNLTLMEMLRAKLAQPVDPVEALGWDGDAMEAEAFALLAVRSFYGMPLTFSGTTGVKAPLTGGRIIF